MTNQFSDSPDAPTTTKTNRRLRVRRKQALHTQGTKWYAVAFIEFFVNNIKSEPSIVVKTWGGVGKTGSSSFETGTIDDYEKAIALKVKWKSKQRYEFGMEVDLDEQPSTEAFRDSKALRLLDFSMVRKTEGVDKKVRSFLRPLDTETVTESIPVFVPVDITQIVPKKDYGQEWGSFS